MRDKGENQYDSKGKTENEVEKTLKTNCKSSSKCVLKNAIKSSNNNENENNENQNNKKKIEDFSSYNCGGSKVNNRNPNVRIKINK